MGKQFFVPLLLIIIAGCDLLSTSSEESKREDLIPLQVGNTWVHRTRIIDARDNGIRSEETDTLTVVGDTLVSGERWYSIRSTFGSFLATNREDGYWTSLPPEIGPLKPTLGYKYPAEVGETFMRPSWPDSATIRVISLDTTVTVELGTFTAAHYAQISEEGDEPQPCDFFVAPGVGILKKVSPWVNARTGEVLRYEVEELIAYELK